MFRIIFHSVVGCLLILGLGQGVSAQEKSGSTETLALLRLPVLETAADSTASATTDEASEKAKPATKDAEKHAGKASAKSSDYGDDAPKGKLSRWFELQSATISTRYRASDNSASVVTANQLQHEQGFKGRFKLTPSGNYSINAGLFSGTKFGSAWNNTGVGTGHSGTNMYLRQLFFAAQPVSGVELQYGGLYLERGESTEITSYDNDGYVMGQRVSVKRPKNFFLDEITVTYGHLGDTSKPDIRKRFHRLNESNYHQFLVRKKVGYRAVLSADYTFHAGVETLRQAVKFKTEELRVLDSVRFENYQRLDVKPDYGFAVTGEKALHKRLLLSGGFAQVDPHAGSLNADSFSKGKRLFVMSKFKVRPDVTISTVLNRAVANEAAVPVRTYFYVAFQYDLLKALKKTGLF